MSDIVNVIAKAINPDAFNWLPTHGPGECPVCDDNREAACEQARVIIAALREAGYHIETEFETEVGIALQGEEGVVFGP